MASVSNIDFLSALLGAAKLRDYLFDPLHSEGWPKGRFLISIGFDINDLDSVALALKNQASNANVVATFTKYGTKFEADGAITAPNGSKVQIRTVWIIDLGAKVPRFVTFKPLRKTI